MPDDEWDWLRPRLTRVHLRPYTTVLERGEAIVHAYFIEEGLLAYTFHANAKDPEVAVALAGPETFFGSWFPYNQVETALYRIVSQTSATILRIGTRELAPQMASMPGLRTAAMQAVRSGILQFLQTAACNTSHGLQQRLARWLLSAQDRLGSDELFMTQEQLGLVLGTGRTAVTGALGTLQHAGLVRQRRGRIVIEDRPGLMAASCGCYQALKDGTERWVGGVPPGRDNRVA